MANPLIIGIDASSKSIALVAKHPVTPTAATVLYPLTNGRDPYKPDHAKEAMDCMLQYVKEITPLAIPGAERIAYVEMPLVGGSKNIQTTIKQSYVNGVIQAVLVAAGFSVYLVNVSTWKLTVCGNGSADKTQIGNHLKRVWPVVYSACNGEQDLYDAASICLYGDEVERRRVAGL
jgi:Holliday junction resolvasome RuvABC endonuclease subunit